MIPILLSIALFASYQSNAELAKSHVQADRPALGRYYASLAALEMLPRAAALGEGHDVSWAYLANEPLRPILIERTPKWGRIVQFDIATGKMLWKAQLYASSAEPKGTMADILRRQSLGAVYKTGGRDQFDVVIDHHSDIAVYQLQPSTGTLIRSTFRFGEPEAIETYRAESSEALKRLGFP